MEMIKRHKGLAIVGGLTLILLIIILIIFSRMLFSTGKNEYGDRLNNIVKIDKKIFDEVKKETEELNEVELPITEKYVQQLELSLTQNKTENKNNKINDISLNLSLNDSIIKDFDEDKIKICKNFKCNYGLEKEKKSATYSREQRYKKIMNNANKELEDTYDNNYVKKKFNKDITVFNPESGKEGIYKDIIQKTTLQ